MKITWIVNNINQVGGIEKVVCNLSSVFSEKNNWDVEIISLYSSKSNLFFNLNMNVRVIHCSLNVEDLSKTSLFKNIKSIIQKIDSNIIITCHEDISIAVILNKNLFHGKIIATQHCNNSFFTTKRKLVNAFFYRFADRFVVLTENDKCFYDKYRVKTEVIPNATYLRQHQISTVNNKEIISVGRLTEVKGFDLLIDAFALIHKKHEDWKLKIVGDGELRKALEKKVKDLNIEESVTITGFVNDVYSELKDAGIYVVSSKSEGFSMSFIEAMECGLPIISFDLPSSREIMGENYWGIVPNNDVYKLSEAINKLIASESLRANLSEVSLNRIQKYSIDNVNAQWINLIKNL